MEKNIKISIIVPVYNTRKFLEKCIDSVIKQDFKNYELILINDGSTDGSLEICKKFANKYDFIKSVSQDNGGVSKARNTGLSLAEGKYVIFLDADDSIEINSLRTLFLEAEKNDSDMVIGSYNKLRFSNKVGKVIRKNECVTREEVWNDMNKYEGYINTPWAKLYRLEIIKENKLLFQEGRSIGEDYKFNRQYLQCINSNIIIIDKVVYNYRMGGLASTVVYHKELNKLRKESLNEYIDYNKKNNLIIYDINKRASKQIYECFQEHIVHLKAVDAASKIKETIEIYDSFFEEKYMCNYLSFKEMELLNKKLYVEFVNQFKEKRFFWYIKKKSLIKVRVFLARLSKRL